MLRTTPRQRIRAAVAIESGAVTDDPIDPRWPKLLSLTVHELRTPVSVVAGYIRMLLQERAGELNDQQKRLLGEAEKSTGRLSALIGEISELSALEAGTAPLTRSATDLRALLDAAVAGLPPMPDGRNTTVEVESDEATAPVDADPRRLTAALGAVLVALRRELVTSNRLTVTLRSDRAGWLVTIAEAGRTPDTHPDAVTAFDEWRGGVGLSLANARRMIEQHGGRIASPVEHGKAAAVLTFPAV